jgi:hypothetical protein
MLASALDEVGQLAEVVGLGLDGVQIDCFD